MTRGTQTTLAWAVILSQFGPSFMFSGVAVALPDMAVDLGAGGVVLGLVESLFLAGAIALVLPIGRVADATDKITLYKIGLLSFAGLSIVVALCSWVPGLLAARFAQGLASAVFTATGPAVLTDLVPPNERGRAYGRMIASIYAGLGLGPLVAGILVTQWGWRSVFYAGALLILASFSLVALMLPSKWKPAQSRLPWASAWLLALASLSLVLGSATVHYGAVGILPFVGTALLLWQFFRHEANIPTPLINVRELANNRALSRSLVAQSLLYINAASFAFLFSLVLQVCSGYPATTAGQLLAISTAVMAVTAPIAGALADRTRPRSIVVTGIAVLIISSIGAATLNSETQLGFFVAILILQGLGYGLFSSPNMTIIMSSVPNSQLSMASALGAYARSTGMVLGMTLTTVILATTVGNESLVDRPTELLQTTTIAFSCFAALALVALLVASRAQQRR